MGRIGIAVLLALVCASAVFAQEAVQLPAPETTGGMPLMEALNARHSTRAFGSKELSDQILSNLLWAGFGVNREDGKRTAPSTQNWQEIDIYVVMQKGAFLYDAKANALTPVSAEDFRALAGMQGFVKNAPVNLVYVADTTKMRRVSKDDIPFYIGADTGLISQNVYLFCASEGLNTVVRGSVDKAALGKALNLRETQIITLAQTVGYPE